MARVLILDVIPVVLLVWVGLSVLTEVVRLVRSLRRRLRARQRNAEPGPIWPIVPVHALDHDWHLPNLSLAPVSFHLAARSGDVLALVDQIGSYAGTEFHDEILERNTAEIMQILTAWYDASTAKSGR